MRRQREALTSQFSVGQVKSGVFKGLSYPNVNDGELEVHAKWFLS